MLSVIDNVAPISYSCAVALASLNVWPTKRSPHFWQELALSYTGNDAALSIYPTRGSNQIHIQNMWPTKRAPHFWLELALSCIGNVAALLTYTTRGSNQTHIWHAALQLCACYGYEPHRPYVLLEGTLFKQIGSLILLGIQKGNICQLVISLHLSIWTSAVTKISQRGRPSFRWWRHAFIRPWYRFLIVYHENKS
jgi:hypothetical protein